ncbi:MAG: PAS domain S-box protein, partial [Deltaproteobacteria bacterium]|nr:PAS domain S-box protein [Deltaproteobacteria bacterium]
MQHTDKPTLLVVDDDEGSRYATARVIRKEGFPVIEAANGREALKQAAKGPGLVVLDVNLPDIDGFEVCRQLKADPATSHIPILHLSASFLDDVSKVRGLDMGADAYLIQPVEPAVLLATINALLRMKRAEEALRESEQQNAFKAELLWKAPVIAAFHDAELNVVWANKAYQEAVGLPVQEMAGRKCYHVWRLTKPCNNCPVVKAIETGEFSEAELTPQNQDHWPESQGYWLSRAAPVKDADGKIIGAIETAIDITPRCQAEEALRESEARLQSIFRAAPVGIGMVVNRVFMEVNQGFCDLTGYGREELIGRSARLIYPSEEEYERVGREKYAQFARSDIGEVQTRFKRRDGSIIDVLMRSTPKDPADLSAGVVFTALDITARQQAEAAFHVLVNRAPMGIYIVQDGRFKMVNPGFAKITGYPEEELIGRHSLDLVAPEYREEVRRNALRMLRGEAQTPYELPIVTKSGETRWALEKVAATVYQGRRAALGYCLDITDKKNLEAQFLQAQKMEAVGRLAGGVAHDFNNMLSVILGYCDIMQMELHQDDPLSRYLAEIKQGAQRAATLTQQLLAFSRKQIIQPEVLDLNTKIAGLEKMLQRLIGEDIDLAVVLDPSLDAVKADPGQIDQIIMNLAVNARDAMPQGGRLTLETANVYLDEPYLRTHAYVIPGPYVMLAVSDNGQGMDAATRARIFEPFFTTKEDGRGTGLGLATVYGIVKQNNGYIHFYSEIGQGSTFKIYLPSTREEVPASRPEIPGVEGKYGSETILVVEDEDLVRNYICRSLKLYGYKVLEAQNGGEALLHCECYTAPIHLLLTDVVMPRMSGRELVERLKPLRPDLRVLYMSGYTANAVVHHGVVEATVAFIQKPFPVNKLVEKIRQI